MDFAMTIVMGRGVRNGSAARGKRESHEGPSHARGTSESKLVAHPVGVCRRPRAPFLTPHRGRAELIGWGPRSAVFPAWARSHTCVGQRVGPRPMTLFMALS